MNFVVAPTVFAAFLAIPALLGQTPVSVLVPHTTPHDHYLFNRSFTYDGQDYTGLPWLFYYVNVGSSPAPTTLRTRCTLQPVSGVPYDHSDFGWFRFPAPGGPWVTATGTEPLAATGEYLETSRFGPAGSANPAGFQFNGEFAGETNPPTSEIQDQQNHFFVEVVYFTDRECSDGGTEYGWYRNVASSASGDMPANSVTFYYAIFNNCNIDYGCWDVFGHQVQTKSATVTITNLAPNADGVYQYKYQAIRSGSDFNLSVLDPSSENPVSCQWSISTGGGSSGTCQFSVPVESWFPSVDQINSGYIVVATQSSHLYPALAGEPYPEWYDYGPEKLGGAPPANIVPTSEPNGRQSCITQGRGYACLNAVGLQVLYE